MEIVAHATLEPFTTKDGSTIREYIHSPAQSLAEATLDHNFDLLLIGKGVRSQAAIGHRIRLLAIRHREFDRLGRDIPLDGAGHDLTTERITKIARNVVSRKANDY